MKVSLLIAMHNEAEYIERCLASVFAQDYPSDKLEILVLDGQSTDGSWGIVERLFEGRSNSFLLDNPGITQSAGWNLGIARSTGDIIGIVSAHSELAPDYVTKAVETLQRTGADLIGGPMRAVGVGNVAKAVSLATSTPFGVGGARFHYTQREEEVDTVYMGLCRRELYTCIGGFDEEMVRNQDDELSYRLLKYGGRIVCNPEIRSQYYNRSTFRSLCRQYFQYGFWKVRVLQRHPRQIRSRQFVPPAFVAALGCSALLAPFLDVGVILLALVGGAYIIVNILTSLWVGRRNPILLPLLPVTFATLHLSYGSGFLWGLLQWRGNQFQDSRQVAEHGHEPGLKID